MLIPPSGLAAVLAEVACRFWDDADGLVAVGVPGVWVAAAELQAGPSVECGGGEPDAVHAEPQRCGCSLLDILPAVVAVVQRVRLGVLDDEVTVRGQLEDRYRGPPERHGRGGCLPVIAGGDGLELLDGLFGGPEPREFDQFAVPPDQGQRTLSAMPLVCC